jgi:hypothetical protein
MDVFDFDQGLDRPRFGAAQAEKQIPIGLFSKKAGGNCATLIWIKASLLDGQLRFEHAALDP